MTRTASFCTLLAATACCVASACGKPAAPAAQSAAPAKIEPAAPVAAVAPPAPATATAAPAKPAVVERKIDVSVALFIDAGQKNAAAMPQAGKPATIRVTPTAPPRNQAVRELLSVMNAKLLLVALRTDGPWWINVQRAVTLSEPERSSHVFRTTFPTAGNYVLYFLFQPVGGEIASVPAYIHVEGKPSEAPEMPALTRRHLGKDGMDVQLLMDKDVPEVCEPVRVASLWLKKGKPVRLSGAPNGPAVHYLAMDIGNSGLQVGRVGGPASGLAEAPTLAGQASPAAVRPAGKGDAGSEAWFTFDRPGMHRVVALAEIQGKQEVVSAPFVINVAGVQPVDGCPK
jgi:hypothetical protein